jgi:hypothetical protein
MSNVVQLPYRWVSELGSDYRERRSLWIASKGWITNPIPLPSWNERIEAGKRQIENRTPPTSAAVLRSAS